MRYSTSYAFKRVDGFTPNIEDFPDVEIRYLSNQHAKNFRNANVTGYLNEDGTDLHRHIAKRR